MAMNKNKIYFLIFTLLCYCGLIYQTITLLIEYKDQKVVVDIEYKDNIYHEIPAITICFKRPLSLMKVARMFPNKYKQVYQDYLKHLESGLNMTNETTKAISEINYGLDDPGIIANLFNLTISVDDKDDIITIANKTDWFEDIFSVRLEGYDFSKKENVDEKLTRYAFFKPVQTVKTGLSIETKCFTYMSNLNVTE